MAGMKIRFTGKNFFGSYKKNTQYCILFFILALSVPLLTTAKETTGNIKPLPIGALEDIAASQENGELTVIMKTDCLLEPSAYRLDNPSRLVLDFPNTVNKVPFMKLPLDTASAKQLRVSQFQSEDPKITRVVFDLEKEFGSHNITVDKAFVKITLFPGKTAPDKIDSSSLKKSGSMTVKPPASDKGTPAVKADLSPAKQDPVKTVPGPAGKTESMTVKPPASDKGTPAVKADLSPAKQDPVKTVPGPAGKTESMTMKHPASDKGTSPVKADLSPAKQDPVKTVSGPAEKAESTTVKPPASDKGTSSVKADLSPAKQDSVKTVSGPAEKAESTIVKPPASDKGTSSVKADLSPAKQDSVKTVSGPAEKAESTVVGLPLPAESASLASSDFSSGINQGQDPAINNPKTSLEKHKNVPVLIASLSPIAEPATNAPPVEATVPAGVVQTAKTSKFTGQLLTLDFVDLPLVDFFRVMSEEGGINIVLDPKVKGNISIKVEKLPWDQIFDMVLVNHSLDKQIEGNLIRIAHKSTLQDEAKQKEALKKAELLAADLETRVKRLNYAKADTLINALEDLKTVRGTVVKDERTNSLILTDLPKSLDEMMQLIKTLDIPQPQVEIEARIVSATRDFAREIGIQFGFVQGNLDRVTVGGPNTFGTIGGTRPSATPTSTYAAGDPSTGRGASTEKSSESAAVSTGDAGNYNVNLPATKAFGGLGISIGNIFDTFLLDAALTAGESKGLAKLISQPKVTAQNNSPAVISQGTRFPVLVNANNTVTVQFFNAALTLTTTPQITYEGNIILDLKVENNTADWARNVDGVPSIRISESSSRVLISDGGTTVIGGILIDEESNSGDKVPGLGSLPIIGNLFKRTAVSRSTQEVLFFVTPRIIN
jgi:type IV pilus secretin PilQ/predicted competence protein